MKLFLGLVGAPSNFGLNMYPTSSKCAVPETSLNDEKKEKINPEWKKKLLPDVHTVQWIILDFVQGILGLIRQPIIINRMALIVFREQSLSQIDRAAEKYIHPYLCESRKHSKNLKRIISLNKRRDINCLPSWPAWNQLWRDRSPPERATLAALHRYLCSL